MQPRIQPILTTGRGMRHGRANAFPFLLYAAASEPRCTVAVHSGGRLAAAVSIAQKCVQGFGAATTTDRRSATVQAHVSLAVRRQQFKTHLSSVCTALR